jgi:hypothetical protein
MPLIFPTIEHLHKLFPSLFRHAPPAFGLVAHEISHQWFGDSVTEKDWDNAWLSEGFATYEGVRRGPGGPPHKR